MIALGATVACLLVTCAVVFTVGSSVPLPLLVGGPLLHGVILCGVVLRALRRPGQLQGPCLDGLMVLSLSYILWYVVLPLFFPGEMP